MNTHTCILLTACSCEYFNNKKPFPDPSPGYISCSLATLQISNTTDRPISWLSFFTEHLVGEMCVSVKLKMINRQKEVWNPSGACGGRLQAEDGSLTKTLVLFMKCSHGGGMNTERERGKPVSLVQLATCHVLFDVKQAWGGLMSYTNGSCSPGCASRESDDANKRRSLRSADHSLRLDMLALCEWARSRSNIWAVLTL